MRQIKIGQKLIGEDCPTFIIAEIGSNFNTLDEAFKSIDAAIDCGVDAVKFQTFRADTVAKRDAVDRVPFFGDLPYVGFLFKRTQEEESKSELLIFVTPKILKENLKI